METFGKHLVYAVRGLRKSPGFTLSASAILTLGIGANTAIFGIVNAVLLKPLPFPKPDSIVTVFHVPPAQSFPGIKRFAVSAANYLDWRKQNSVFDSMAVIGGRLFRLGGNRPEAIRAVVTEPGFFTVLQVQPEFGRAFTADECQPGRDDVVVLSHGFAENHFGSSRNAVGQTLEINGRNTRIIGVMPQKFQAKAWAPASTDAWAPLAWKPEEASTRGNHNYLVIARMRPGVTVAQAQSQMNVISDRLAREYPEEDKGWGAVVSSLRDTLVGNVRPALLTLLGGGWIRVAHRLREYREPGAGANHRPPQGAGHSSRAGRECWSSSSSGVGGNDIALGDWRGNRTAIRGFRPVPRDPRSRRSDATRR
jgi:hypothetical protein